MPCTGPHEVTSTVTEHETVVARDHVSANAPAGSRGVASTRTSQSRPNAACTDTTSPSSRAQPRGRDPHARGQTRQSPRLPRRHGASHDLACRDFSPRTCRTLRAHLDDLHARRSLSCASILVTPPSSSDKSLEQRRWMPCPWPREVTSTVTEHELVAARDHVLHECAGRIEGSREHSSLAVTSGTQHAQPRRPRPHDTSDAVLIGQRRCWLESQDRARSAGLPGRSRRSHCPGIASRGSRRAASDITAPTAAIAFTE
jgi:hypothetical protein